MGYNDGVCFRNGGMLPGQARHIGSAQVSSEDVGKEWMILGATCSSCLACSGAEVMHVCVGAREGDYRQSTAL